MQKVYKTIIIGGGASGLFCAIDLCSGDYPLNGEDVLILERLPRVGKKLIATGNGQCNLSNKNLSPKNYHGDKGFIKTFFDGAKEINLESEFLNLGIPLISDEKGRLYPVSRQASALLDVFRESLENLKVNIQTEARVKSVKKCGDVYKVESEKGDFFTERVVFSCGGKAGSQFGTDGTAYKLLENFGHTTTSTYPSLVQIKTEREKIKGLKGIKETAKVTLLDGDEVLKEETGDVLFTDYGVSGNAIFYLSSAYYQAKNPMLKLEFLPFFGYEETLSVLERKKSKLKNFCQENALLCIVNKKIANAICKEAKDITPKALTESLKAFYIKPIGTLSFDSAQVTRGGIDTKDVNPFTLKSKLEKGFFITGEMLNVDGDCGGYNLHFAFLSAKVVATEIKKSIQGETKWVD